MRDRISFGSKAITLESSALTTIAYKKVFNEDILQIIDRMAGEHEREDTNASLEAIGKLAFIMSKQAEGISVAELLSLDEMTYYEWLNTFDRSDLMQADFITNTLRIWNGNLTTTIDSKNAESAQQDL